MKASQNNKIAKGGQEITLMTVLANEATGQSRKLLKKYGQPDAKNYQDLEIKLAQLYFNTKDKVELEKQLAEIHPHKNWILKNVQPVIEEKSKQEQVEEVKSNATGDNICPQCNRKNRELDFLYAEGPQQPAAKSDLNMLIVPVMLLAMVGLTYIVVLKGIQK
jgi:CHASE3 domain sensor protein